MAKSLSIIVPTYHEAENLPILVGRIAATMEKTSIKWEVIVVDDNSQDSTVSVCEALAKLHPLQLIVRTNERGLSSAVIAGMQASSSDVVLCMDADLSHPAESIPTMFNTLSEPDCDFVIGSRYVSGGSTDDTWGLFRWFNSAIATALAKPLTSAKDPMAGFFALRRADFDRVSEKLDVVGYKIGLELIVKCGCRNVREVPIHFADRQFGESKLSLKEQINYLRHLNKLYSYRWPEFIRFMKFGFVGLSGVVVNLAALSVLLSFSLQTPLAMAASIWVAMTWNFLLNQRFTFQDCSSGKLTSEYIRFCAASMTGALVNWSVATTLFSQIPFFNLRPTMAGLVGIGAGMFLNFVLCRKFVFFNLEETTEATSDCHRFTSDQSENAA